MVEVEVGVMLVRSRLCCGPGPDGRAAVGRGDGHRGSTGWSDQASRTQAWAGSSPKAVERSPPGEELPRYRRAKGTVDARPGQYGHESLGQISTIGRHHGIPNGAQSIPAGWSAATRKTDSRSESRPSEPLRVRRPRPPPAAGSPRSPAAGTTARC